ncbi:MAG: alpha/beta hydrolase-fold protein [Cyclobacteriaceae bacterium]
MLRIVTFLLCFLILLSCKEDEDPKLYSVFDLDSPQLGVTKTIWLYLPGDYDQSNKSYPVIYFSDAQWLFETNTNYSQEMHVDEMMRDFERDGFEGAIVVGIESDEDTRHEDFSLFWNKNFLGGNGQAYLDFLTQTLKPKIDEEYRTKPDRENTCIMGASLGGLASFYALTEYPDVFGKAALFSAALHFNADSVFRKAARGEVRLDAKIYAVVGAQEFTTLVNFPEDNQKLFNLLQSKGRPPENLFLKIDADGEHKIGYWEREFPGAIQFLF